MRAQECLEDHIDESAFSAGCKEELEDMIAKVFSLGMLTTNHGTVGCRAAMQYRIMPCNAACESASYT